MGEKGGEIAVRCGCADRPRAASVRCSQSQSSERGARRAKPRERALGAGSGARRPARGAAGGADGWGPGSPAPGPTWSSPR
eukprot:3028091-Prymnesium_polylepis.1